MAVTQTQTQYEQYQQAPQPIRDSTVWAVWRFEQRTGKNGKPETIKMPYSARSGRAAKANDPQTWSTITEAVERFLGGRNGLSYDGIGFYIIPPFVGADFDGCYHNGVLEPEADRIYRELNCYSEVSVSGTGAHTLAMGELPPGKREFKYKDRPHHGIALYDGGRFFIFTGQRIGPNPLIEDRTTELRAIHARLFPPKEKSAPKPPSASSANNAADGLTDDEILEKARKANRNFPPLWEGSWEGIYPSQSEADSALCCILAFWTAGDAARIDAIFRRSGLFRETGKGKDYLERTINAAIRFCPNFYQPPKTREKQKTRGPDQQPFNLQVDADTITPTVDLLNACAVFAGKIKFLSVKRRGGNIVADVNTGRDAIWHSIADLLSFLRSQSILADATDMIIPTPARRSMKSVWEPAAQLILRLASTDSRIGAESRCDEFRHLIPATWKKAGMPVAGTDTALLAMLKDCQAHVRDPYTATPPKCCVWHDTKNCYIHQPTFIEWLSTPGGQHRRYEWEFMRDALYLLEFAQDRVHRSVNGEAAIARLWRGPLELLVDDETSDEHVHLDS